MTLQMNFLKLNIILCLCTIGFVKAQDLSVEQMRFLTPLWEGDRFDDGRPRVGDDILKRMKQVSIEEAWGVLRNEGYHNQFESGWEPLHDDIPMVGRALTVQYLPNRPDVAQQIIKKRKGRGRSRKYQLMAHRSIGGRRYLCSRWIWKNCRWNADWR